MISSPSNRNPSLSKFPSIQNPSIHIPSTPHKDPPKAHSSGEYLWFVSSICHWFLQKIPIVLEFRSCTFSHTQLQCPAETFSPIPPLLRLYRSCFFLLIPCSQGKTIQVALIFDFLQEILCKINKKYKERNLVKTRTYYKLVGKNYWGGDSLLNCPGWKTVLGKKRRIKQHTVYSSFFSVHGREKKYSAEAIWWKMLSV